MLTFKDVTKDEHLVSPKQPKYKRGMHPNSLKNLLGPRWQKGQSGNPNGYSLTAALKDALTLPLKQPAVDAPVRDHIVYATLEGAILREPTPFKEVWDRIEGKSKISPEEDTDNLTYTTLVKLATQHRLLMEAKPAPDIVDGEVVETESRTDTRGRTPT